MQLLTELATLLLAHCQPTKLLTSYCGEGKQTPGWGKLKGDKEKNRPQNQR